jgi:hypothetical protein
LVLVEKYNDNVLCDVVPWHITYLLLGDLDNLIEKLSMMGLRMIFS